VKDVSSRDPQVFSLFSDLEREGQPSAPSAEPNQTDCVQVSDESDCGRSRWTTVRQPSAPSAVGPTGVRARPLCRRDRPPTLRTGIPGQEPI
jgi:hypothetical protein